LVEWPVVYECHFDKEFLGVPEECLILTMQTNQKYFPCTLGGALTNRFLVVSNIATEDPSAIINGNERVVRPRLADAQFFFNQDRKKTLESRVDGLSRVVYHNKLGSQYERMQRVCAIAEAIAQQIGDDALVENTVMAARLAKTDLLTDMVGEFPELQGVMGWYYARLEKLPNEVALAIADHYKPRFAGDELPSNQVGLVVALADKLETLVGMFGIGNLPTGDKDPFALRRHALGVVRMLAEKASHLSLKDCLDASRAGFRPYIKTLNSDPASNDFWANVDQLPAFIYDRFSGSLREQGYTAQEVDAVLSLRPPHLSEVAKRLAAVRTFAQLPEAPALAAANKRVGNILKKAEGAVEAKVNPALLQVDEEKALHTAINSIAARADKAWAEGDYTANLQALAALKEPVDAFFDKVMVNAADPALKVLACWRLCTTP
jgi:glycyl-tRNA synthetase beta chain